LVEAKRRKLFRAARRYAHVCARQHTHALKSQRFARQRHKRLQNNKRYPASPQPNQLTLPQIGNSDKICAMKQIKQIARTLKRDIKVYALVLKDEKTPLLGKIFLGMAVGYFFMPFDLIPDFIPVLGHLDDVVIIPILIFIALRLIPRSIIKEYREKVISD
jgi:uncharacterized membrane protein YkvA (DUF1232 family)